MATDLFYPLCIFHLTIILLILLLASLTFFLSFILFHEELSYEAICSDFPVDFLEIKKKKKNYANIR